MRHSLISCTLAFCGACHAAPHVSDRLVPGDLIIDEEMSQELIEIQQGFGGDGYGIHRLSYLLNAEDELEVSYWFMPNDEAVVKETYRLASDDAERVRGELWRLRPEALSRDWMNDRSIRPLNCQQLGPHDQGEILVHFIGDPNYQSLASFELPTEQSCKSAAAREARQVLFRIVRSLPASDIAIKFQEAKSSGELRPSMLIEGPIPSLMKSADGGGN